MADKQTILIIGGGNAGINIAKSLSEKVDPSKFRLIMVTERAFHIHYPAMIRTSVTSEGSLEKLALNPYDRLFKPGRAGEIIVGKVEKVEDGVATLVGGSKIAYSWLVLATGTRWEGPLSLPLDRSEAIQWINSWRSKIAKAQRIVLIGGGSVGIEFAGEISHFYPNKQVTIVHGMSELLNPTYPSKFRTRVERDLRGKGVNIILNDRLELPTGEYTSVVTKNGIKLDADLVIPTKGGRLNTEFLKSFDPTIITENDTVKILPTFRVPLANGKENVFALGDIIDWKEQKGLSKIPSHVAVASVNILNAINAQPVNKYYKGFMDAIGLPYGPNGGATYIPFLWGIILGNWLTSLMKSRTLFVNHSRKPLGY